MAGLLCLLAGCATHRIDWARRVGHFRYDQEGLGLGTPDKNAKLTDGTMVAEWLTRRGYAYSYASYPYPFYAGWYGPYYPGYINSYTTPDYFVRLTFGPDGQLRDWKRFYK